MEGIQTTGSDRRHELPLSGPHFADERTIRSAQPVVPFETLAKEQRRRGLMLGGAFVIACLLGATAAMALIRLRQPRTVPQAVNAPVEAETTDENEDQATAKATTTEPEPVSDSQPIAQADTLEVAEPQQEKPKNKAKKHALGPSPVRITVVTSPPSGDARLVDQWEEKRQRRVRPRDPQQNHHSDLFRIREIFEGPRRSRRANN